MTLCQALCLRLIHLEKQRSRQSCSWQDGRAQCPRFSGITAEPPKADLPAAIVEPQKSTGGDETH